MKTYVWLSPEKLKFINETPSVLSILYDLGLLPEEVSARTRGYVEEERARCLLIIAECMKDSKPPSDEWNALAAVACLIQQDDSNPNKEQKP